jgi:hypothetical protein
VLPTVTSPTLRLAGLALMARLTPVPESETVAGELVALLTIARLPVALPATVGAKVTVNVALWPAATVRGRESPIMLGPGVGEGGCLCGSERPPVLKPVPVTVSPETTTLALPVLVRVTVWVLLLPT